MPKRQAGGEFFSGTMSGHVYAETENGVGFTDGGVVGTMGEKHIANSERLRANGAERVFRGAPKFWKVTNRAQLGNVKVWCGAFDGEIFPEAATSDKRTWLQPGDSMVMPIEAGLHFFGNVFDTRAVDAADVIERCGGFELEGAKETQMHSAPRIVGGPIGLPDFIIEPIDGRMRLVGTPIAIYERYDKATRKLWKLRKNKDPELLEEEKALLAARIAEYTLDDLPLYDDRGRVIDRAPATCDCSPIAHTRGVVGCAHSSANKQAVILGAPSNEVEKEEYDEEPDEDEEEVLEQEAPSDDTETVQPARRSRRR